MVNGPPGAADRRTRRGFAAVEEVMVLAVVLPIVAAAFYLGVRLFRLFHEVAVTIVGWPFP
jgi:hypothetical protein